MIPFSVLDLSPILEGANAAHAFRNTLDLARQAERLGYRRYWLAEHHGMPGIASAATSIVIAHVAGGTSGIRVGAGGIMLPNHAPLVIAEQFGTLESLYPGRIDLGIGRAPGTDPVTARALRRSLQGSVDSFPHDVAELMAYFRHPAPGQTPVAVPGAGLHVPVWILGSSIYGAQLAAMFGLPYAFASHFAPAYLMQAIETYRREFRPSDQLSQPYVMVGVNVVAADTDDEARVLVTSLQQAFVNLRSGRPSPLPPPRAGYYDQLSAIDRATLDQTLTYSVVGAPDTVRRGLQSLIAATAADELMVTSQIYDHASRIRSYELAAAARDELSRAGAGASSMA